MREGFAYRAGFAGRGKPRPYNEIGIVVSIWVVCDLNPHPFKIERVRHPKAVLVAGLGRCWSERSRDHTDV